MWGGILWHMKHCSQSQFNVERCVQYIVKMVNEIGEKYEQQQLMRMKNHCAKYSESYMDEQENRTARSFSPLSLHCSQVSNTHITRYYFCLSGITFLSFFFLRCSVSCSSTPSICNCFFSEIIQHQIHGFHNCRFPEQSVVCPLFDLNQN